jgi:hypothetical protein
VEIKVKIGIFPLSTLGTLNASLQTWETGIQYHASSIKHPVSILISKLKDKPSFCLDGTCVFCYFSISKQEVILRGKQKAQQKRTLKRTG